MTGSKTPAGGRRSNASPFDRVRTRTPGEVTGATRPTVIDLEGKRALFSQTRTAPVSGRLSIECSRCRQVSVLSLFGAVRAATPSVHLPLLHRGFPSWMRCPECGRHAWVRIRLRL